jgi:DNA primase small subunit
VLDEALREDFGFKHLLWVYSGRRGIHVWISDREAFDLADDARKAIVGWLEVIKGGASQVKKVDAGWMGSAGGRSLHPSLRRAIGGEGSESGPLKLAFVDTVLKDQDCFRTPEQWAVLLQLLPSSEAEAIEKLRSKWERASSRSSLEKWQDVMECAQRAGEYKSQRLWRPCLEDIILQYTYPRIDAEVSKHLNHLLKSPFVVHPATGKVCVPLEPAKVFEFDPDADCPTVAQLLRQLNSYEAAHKDDNQPTKSNYKNNETASTTVKQDWEKTSLRPFVQLFEKHCNAIAKETRALRRAQQEQQATDF